MVLYNIVRFLSELQRDYAFSMLTLNSVVPEIRKFPGLIKDCLSIEKQMQSKGLFSCVHAQPAHFTLPMALESHLICSSSFFKKVRNEEELMNRGCHEVKQQITSAFNIGRDDSCHEVGEKILSCSYAFLGIFEREESALFFGFSENNNCKAIENSEMMIRKTLHNMSLPEKHASELLKKSKPILKGYSELKVSNFLFIGIPFSLLNQVAYDAKAYGMQNEKEIKRSFHSNQLRVLMGKETLFPQFGLEMVVANHKKEAETYCKDLVWPEKEKKYLEFWLEPHTTEEEKLEQKKRVELDGLVSDYIQQLQTMLKEIWS